MKRTFLIVFIISSIVFSFVFLNLYKNNLNKGTNPMSDTQDEQSSNIGMGIGVSDDQEEEKTEKLKLKNKDEILFLLLGIDTYDITKVSGERTDTMILTSFNFKTGDIKMMSIPRDTKVKIGNKTDQINHAHVFGGIDLTMETVRNFLGVDVEHFIKLDYRAVEEIVESIGGVDIDVPRRMKYDDSTKGKEFHVDLQKGPQTLNGDQAIQFLRWRKNNNGVGYPEGDVGRVKAQQMFLKELVKQTLKPKNILKLDKLAKTYFEYVDTNIPLDTVIKTAWAARKVDIDNMVTTTIPGEGDGKKYYIYNRDELDLKVSEMFGDFLIEQKDMTRE